MHHRYRAFPARSESYSLFSLLIKVRYVALVIKKNPLDSPDLLEIDCHQLQTQLASDKLIELITE